MKTFVHVLLVAACFVACTRSFPSGLVDDSTDDEDFDRLDFNFDVPSYFLDSMNRLKQHLLNMFMNMPDVSNVNVKIPEGANTTSTTKIINGHVVTINETTYVNGDDNSGTVFRLRTIDVKPQNETEVIEGGSTEQPSVRPEPEPESRETVEDFNNEISKNTETLTA